MQKSDRKKNSENHCTYGFCPVFKRSYPISIYYTKSPAPENGHSTYYKDLYFECPAWGHDEPRCTFINKMDCPVYIAAPSSLSENEVQFELFHAYTIQQSLPSAGIMPVEGFFYLINWLYAFASHYEIIVSTKLVIFGRY